MEFVLVKNYPVNSSNHPCLPSILWSSLWSNAPIPSITFIQLLLEYLQYKVYCINKSLIAWYLSRGEWRWVLTSVLNFRKLNSGLCRETGILHIRTINWAQISVHIIWGYINRNRKEAEDLLSSTVEPRILGLMILFPKLTPRPESVELLPLGTYN